MIAPVAAVEDVVTEAATVVEPQVIDTAAPQAVEVETTHPEVIAAPVDAAPQIIAEEDTVVAEEVTEDAEPVSAAEEPADVTVETVTEEVVQDVEIQVEPVVEEVKAPEVKSEPIEVVAAVAPAHVATAPTTRARHLSMCLKRHAIATGFVRHSTSKAKVLPVVTVQRTWLLRQLLVLSLLNNAR